MEDVRPAFEDQERNRRDDRQAEKADLEAMSRDEELPFDIPRD